MSNLTEEQKDQIAAEIDNEGLGYWVMNYGSFVGEDPELENLIANARSSMRSLQNYLDENEIII